MPEAMKIVTLLKLLSFRLNNWFLHRVCCKW